MIVQAASEQHFDFIAERFEETIALWEDYQASPESVAKRREAVRAWSADQNAHLAVAAGPDGQAVGFNSLFIAKDYSGRPYGKIVILYVLPEHRGKGIAGLLKREGECWLRSRGVGKVVTEIDARNERMLAINRQAGFRLKSCVFEREL